MMKQDKRLRRQRETFMRSKISGYCQKGEAEKKKGGDLRQINQLDQRLRSGINTAGATSSHRPGGTSCEVTPIFLTRQLFNYLPPGFIRPLLYGVGDKTVATLDAEAMKVKVTPA